MTRQGMIVNIPQRYIENEKKGLCKVCAKPKSQFNKRMKKYCSDECRWKYSDCFVKWSSLRNFQIWKDDKCKLCGRPAEEVDHIIAIVNGGEEFDPKNLQSLCHECHVQKTKKDLLEYRLRKKQQTTLENL